MSGKQHFALGASTAETGRRWGVGGVIRAVGGQRQEEMQNKVRGETAAPSGLCSQQAVKREAIT